MDKEQIVDQAKAELVELIEQLQVDTLSRDLERIRTYVDFLGSLDKLKSPNRSIHDEEQQSVTEEEQETEEEDPLNKGFLFERKLKGGFVPALNSYVPEKVVRQLNLQEGDLVKAKAIEGGKGRQYFDYEVFQKGDGKDDNRVVIQFCRVVRDGGMLVTNETADGKMIRLDDVPFTIRIRETEVQDFGIEEGDIVDVAYYANKPDSHRIVWKHPMEDAGYKTPLPSSAYKDKKRVERQIEYIPELQNKTAVIIGAIDQRTTYIERLSELGVSVEVMDGTEAKERIGSSIKKADFVLFIIPLMSHQASDIAKVYCKKYDTPFAACDSYGVSTVKAELISLARKEHDSKVEST